MFKKVAISTYEFMSVFSSAREREDDAVKWLRRAAKLGSANAQNQLGTRYAEGLGMSRDKVEAARWYKQAAEQGDMYAQANIGWAFYESRGVTQSYELALSWYKKAAEPEINGRYYEKNISAGDCSNVY